MISKSPCTYIVLYIIIYEYIILKLDTNNVHFEVQVNINSCAICPIDTYCNVRVVIYAIEY